MSVSTHRLRFGLSVRQRAHAAAPSTHIFLQGIVRHANGMLAVTPDCASLAPECTSLEEIEGEIEQLREELDEMLQQARRAFRAGGGVRGPVPGM